ncbi:MAG: LysR family substrate-binding domain-containing protein [Pseudomonadota bacterium]
MACSSAIFENLKAALMRAQSAGVADVGKLRVGSMASFSNGPQRKLIQEFVAQHPDVDLCFVETERRQMMTMLSHRTLDVVISVGERQDACGDSLVLTCAPVYLAVQTDSRWARLESVNWSDLADATFLISARESGPDICDYIIRRATGFGKAVSIARHQVSRDGVINLVGLGFGVTVVGDHAAGAQYPNVTLVPLGGDDECVPFSIIWRPENDNPALRRFISLARIEAKQNGLSA